MDPTGPMDDDQLLAALSHALDAADPPPPNLRDAAIRALTWDLELGRLMGSAGPAEPVALRGAPTTTDPLAHTGLTDAGLTDTGLTKTGLEDSAIDASFELDDHLLDLTVEPGSGDQTAALEGDHRYRLHGILVPPVPHILLLSPGRPDREVACDAYGRFDTVIDRAMVAIGFEQADGSRVRTPILDLP